ncbi:MAG: hypothetical protein ACO3AG_00820 [Fluviibacter sp.]
MENKMQLTAIEKLNLIFALIKEISEEDKVIGDVLMTNYKNAINTIQAISTGTPTDISEQITLITELLGIDLEVLVKTIIEKDYGVNQSGDFVNSGEADKATMDFITGNSQNINNSNNIDDYEKFLAQTKADMEFLKGEI